MARIKHILMAVALVRYEIVDMVEIVVFTSKVIRKLSAMVSLLAVISIQVDTSRVWKRFNLPVYLSKVAEVVVLEVWC